MNHPIAKICAAINADDAGVYLDGDEMREVIDALDERETATGRERTRADAAELAADALRRERDEARAVERERCAALCDAAAARWGTAGDRWKRSNEAAALAAEMRAWPVTP